MRKQSRSWCVTPEERQAVRDLLPVSKSVRQIAAALGMDRNKAQHIAGPIIQAMRDSGTLPACECGQPRFHPRFCSRTNNSWGQGITAEQVGNRESLLAAIMTGAPFPEIGKRFGVHVSTVGRYKQLLTAAQRARRDVLERQRAAPLIDARPTRDHLYRRIASALPAWLENHLRDDVISEAYIAVLEGTVPQDELHRHVERFAKVARNTFTSSWGNRSLDERRFSDSDMTVADFLADPSALAAFDRIFEEAADA